jgi:hypothetical protein
MLTHLTCQPTPLSITDRWTPLVRPVSLILHRTRTELESLCCHRPSSACQAFVRGHPAHVCRGSHPRCSPSQACHRAAHLTLMSAHPLPPTSRGMPRSGLRTRALR